MKRYNFTKYVRDMNPYWIMALISSSEHPFEFYINKDSDFELRKEWDLSIHKFSPIKVLEDHFDVQFCAVRWQAARKILSPDDFLYLGSNAVYYEIDTVNLSIWFYQLEKTYLMEALTKRIRIHSPTDYA